MQNRESERGSHSGGKEESGKGTPVLWLCQQLAGADTFLYVCVIPKSKGFLNRERPPFPSLPCSCSCPCFASLLESSEAVA
eukprot:767804-Hanusia_phi.AAC.3